MKSKIQNKFISPCKIRSNRKVLFTSLIILGQLFFNFVISSPSSFADGTIPIIGEVLVKFDPKNKVDMQKFEDLIVKNQEYKTYSSVGQKGSAVEVVKTSKVGDSSLSELSKTVKDAREAICRSLGNNDEFKLTFTWDASAKVWGIGVGGSTGIEVQIRCKK
jgi:hypothetical protein